MEQIVGVEEVASGLLRTFVTIGGFVVLFFLVCSGPLAVTVHGRELLLTCILSHPLTLELLISSFF